MTAELEGSRFYALRNLTVGAEETSLQMLEMCWQAAPANHPPRYFLQRDKSNEIETPWVMVEPGAVRGSRLFNKLSALSTRRLLNLWRWSRYGRKRLPSKRVQSVTAAHDAIGADRASNILSTYFAMRSNSRFTRSPGFR